MPDAIARGMPDGFRTLGRGAAVRVGDTGGHSSHRVTAAEPLARTDMEHELVDRVRRAIGLLPVAEHQGGDMVGTDEYPALRDAWPELLERLRDADREAALAAAYGLAFLLEPADRTLPALEEAAAAAADPVRAAGFAIAAARLAASVAQWRGATPEVPWEGIALDPAVADAPPLARAVAAIRQVWMLPSFPRKVRPDIAAALDAIAKGTRVGPWGGGDLRELCVELRANLWVQEDEQKATVVYSGDGMQAAIIDRAETVDEPVDEPVDEHETVDDVDDEDEDDIADDEVADPYTQQRPERGAPRVVLAGLRDVDWASLEHAYGPATGVPGMIDGLSSANPADRTWAISGLEASIHHQGSVYPASTAAVPFLVKLLAEPIEDRHRILDLLCGIAVHQPDGCLVQGGRKWRSEAYGAVVAGGPTYVALLDRFGSRVGHAIVIAKEHVEETTRLGWPTYAELQRLAYDATTAIERVLSPARTFVAVLGASAQLPMSFPHFHVHVLPVYETGDGARPAHVFSWSAGVLVYEDDEARELAARLRAAWPAR